MVVVVVANNLASESTWFHLGLDPILGQLFFDHLTDARVLVFVLDLASGKVW